MLEWSIVDGSIDGPVYDQIIDGPIISTLQQIMSRNRPSGLASIIWFCQFGWVFYTSFAVLIQLSLSKSIIYRLDPNFEEHYVPLNQAEI